MSTSPDTSAATPQTRLSGAERQVLRGLAHGLRPVLQVGKGGVTEGFLANVEEALANHELIKIKFSEWKDEKRELSAEIAARTHSELAGLVGHVAIFYRPARDPEKRRIRLPR